METRSDSSLVVCGGDLYFGLDFEMLCNTWGKKGTPYKVKSNMQCRMTPDS